MAAGISRYCIVKFYPTDRYRAGFSPGPRGSAQRGQPSDVIGSHTRVRSRKSVKPLMFSGEFVDTMMAQGQCQPGIRTRRRRAISRRGRQHTHSFMTGAFSGATAGATERPDRLPPPQGPHERSRHHRKIPQQLMQLISTGSPDPTSAQPALIEEGGGGVRARQSVLRTAGYSVSIESTGYSRLVGELATFLRTAHERTSRRGVGGARCRTAHRARIVRTMLQPATNDLGKRSFRARARPA